LLLKRFLSGKKNENNHKLAMHVDFTYYHSHASMCHATWDEVIEIKCKVGWKLVISVVVENNTDDGCIVLFMKPLEVGDAAAGVY
jgi:hypothetical protein